MKIDGTTDRPYEFFRWKSSCGRLVVRTTWVRGVRHVILSDDDDGGDGHHRRRRSPPAKDIRQRHRGKNLTDTTASVPSHTDGNVRTTICGTGRYVTNASAAAANDDDDYYVERVLRWLQKPSVELETSRKPMSAPGRDVAVVGGSNRRPVLIKTCSIPENNSGDPNGRARVAAVDVILPQEPPTRSTVVVAGDRGKNRQKTELHVHIPSTCLPAAATISNLKMFDDDRL